MKNEIKNISIRRLIDTDSSEFINIRLEALKKSPENFGSSFDEEKDYSEVIFLEKIKNNLIIGCFDENELVGIIGISKSHLIKMQHLVSLWGMYVRPKARGFGLSKSLLNFVIAEMKTHCHSIRLSVVATNVAAIRLYESVGFKTWAVDVDALKIGDTYYDEILMRYDM
ncbi:GNAT family N-acetyltransferase [Pectobacterium brasiliense]|uniref:GNAT family N-acetyltransferase n=1 Tax=Pectobacterium brasiliense TaxID=180957 RepID=UPI001968F4B3|nr:GNAT family N-acetyltransferase [Pectobacterium brasiliense]QSD34073.1 GNAT family N-acetyltransferase [Pectobacterium brasiliense]